MWRGRQWRLHDQTQPSVTEGLGWWLGSSLVTDCHGPGHWRGCSAHVRGHNTVARQAPQVCMKWPFQGCYGVHVISHRLIISRGRGVVKWGPPQVIRNLGCVLASGAPTSPQPSAGKRLHIPGCACRMVLVSASRPHCKFWNTLSSPQSRVCWKTRELC